VAEIEIDDEALEVARKTVEDALVERRDSHMFMIGGNGFHIRNYDGSDSSIMRMSTAMGLSLGIKAYLGVLAERGGES
jgi:hypothetical protein